MSAEPEAAAQHPDVRPHPGVGMGEPYGNGSATCHLAVDAITRAVIVSSRSERCIRRGVWHGFWEQEDWGRQPMEAFELHFRGGAATGRGRTWSGRSPSAANTTTRPARFALVKQYLGKHQVLYVGRPDGEGCILGKWTVTGSFDGHGSMVTTGPFRVTPGLPPADRGRADQRVRK